MTQPLWRGISTSLLLAALLSGAAATALAQSHRGVEVSVSYQGVTDTSLSENGMRRGAAAHGWNLDVAVPLTAMIGIVGAVDASHGQETQPITSFGGGSLHDSWTDMGYLGGMRWQVPLSSRIAPLFQVLGGILQSRQKTEYHTAQPLPSFSNTEHVWLVDLGAGVNLTITRRLGARFGGDSRIDPVGVALQGDDTTMARVHAGVVFTIP
jgi:hypothetical protein